LGKRPRLWLALFAAGGIALFFLAISNAAYEATSPDWLTWHVLLRKSYSVAAFGLIGFLLARTTQEFGRAWGWLRVSASVGVYSAIIELFQRQLSGARESLEQQAFDVAMGLIGGAIGALLAARVSQQR
jgi:hypothetical protein